MTYSYKEPPILHSYVEPSVVNASLPFHFVLPKPALPAMQLHSFDVYKIGVNV